MNRVTHFEIHADDPARASNFYSSVFGWKIEKWTGGGAMEYWTVITGDKASAGIDGGLIKRMGPKPQPDNPVSAYVCTIEVENIDMMLNTVTQIGGTMAVPKRAILGMGWLAYCKDTEGNVFGLMQIDPNAK